MAVYTITTRVLVALIMIATPWLVQAGDDVRILQNALQEHFPDVVRWDVQPVKALHAKREMERFAQSDAENADMQIEIYRDGALFAVRTDRTVHYLVKAYVQMPAAKKAIRKGNLLTEENVQMEMHDMFAFSCDSNEWHIASSTSRSRRDLRAGEVICSRDVEAAPLISKHDQVVLHCLEGVVHISVPAEAMQEGDMGSRIKVRQDARHPVVMAEVLGKGEVNACI